MPAHRTTTSTAYARELAASRRRLTRVRLATRCGRVMVICSGGDLTVILPRSPPPPPPAPSTPADQVVAGLTRRARCTPDAVFEASIALQSILAGGPPSPGPRLVGWRRAAAYASDDEEDVDPDGHRPTLSPASSSSSDGDGPDEVRTPADDEPLPLWVGGLRRSHRLWHRAGVDRR